MKKFNQKHRDRFAGLAFKIAEIVFAGVVVAGFMQPQLSTWKVIGGFAIILAALFFGYVLDMGTDLDDNFNKKRRK